MWLYQAEIDILSGTLCYIKIWEYFWICYEYLRLLREVYTTYPQSYLNITQTTTIIHQNTLRRNICQTPMYCQHIQNISKYYHFSKSTPNFSKYSLYTLNYYQMQFAKALSTYFNVLPSCPT